MWIGLVVALTCACCLFTCRTTGLACGRMKPSITMRVCGIREERPCLCPRLTSPISKTLLMSAMTRAAETVWADFARREPRWRICRDENVRVLVNRLLDWHGAPIILGRGKTHT